MITINSTTILGIDYENGELTVYFRNGKHYVYHDVPEYVFEQFINAPSKGKFYNQYIKNYYQ